MKKLYRYLLTIIFIFAILCLFYYFYVREVSTTPSCSIEVVDTSRELHELKVLLAHYQYNVPYYSRSLGDVAWSIYYVGTTIAKNMLCFHYAHILSEKNPTYNVMVNYFKLLRMLTPDEVIAFKCYFTSAFAYNYILIRQPKNTTLSDHSGIFNYFYKQIGPMIDTVAYEYELVYGFLEDFSEAFPEFFI